jgi:hypothetical protein
LKETAKILCKEMNLSLKRWRRLFLFCLGLAIGTSFCMKWMEGDFVVNGESFSILGLELFYTKEKVQVILANLDNHVRSILNYHLVFDFAFMAGIFPAITSLCMIGREKLRKPALRRLLFILAILQLVAWGADITENIWLLRWVNNSPIGNDFSAFHWLVMTKWIIALVAVLVALPFALRKHQHKIDN